jgi:hypothetical protein
MPHLQQLAQSLGFVLASRRNPDPGQDFWQA